MNIATALVTVFLGGVLPVWEMQLPATPRGEAHIVSHAEYGQILLIPLGSSGLGGWSAGGVPLPGFPVSNGAGVVLRPAAVPGSTGEILICYADNDRFLHLIDLAGNEAFGWPVENTSNVITGITATDMNDDGYFELTYGTSDEGRIFDASSKYGSQCIVCAIDARRSGDHWEVYTHGGRRATGLDAIEWARRVADLVAGIRA